METNFEQSLAVNRRELLLMAALGSALSAAANTSFAQPAVPQSLVGLTFINPPLSFPRLSLQDDEGGQADPGLIFGTPFIMNLWARWCVPCVTELPSLQRMSVKADGRFKVVLVNQDAGGAAVALPFLRKVGVTEIRTLFDPQGRLYRSLSVRGLPTTFLGDKQGRLIGRFEGAAEWDNTEIIEFAKAVLS